MGEHDLELGVSLGSGLRVLVLTFALSCTHPPAILSGATSGGFESFHHRTLRSRPTCPSKCA